MLAIVRTCWDVCRLHCGPQVFPRSWTLFWVMLIAYAVVDLGLFLAEGLRGWTLLPQLVLDVALLVGFFALVLAVWQKLERLNQTLIALLGSLALIELADVPLSVIATLRPSSIYTDAAGVAQYGILAWSLLVIGYVMRHALNTRLTLGIVLAGSYTLINLVLFAVIFPVKS